MVSGIDSIVCKHFSSIPGYDSSIELYSMVLKVTVIASSSLIGWAVPGTEGYYVFQRREVRA